MHEKGSVVDLNRQKDELENLNIDQLRFSSLRKGKKNREK
jgi:hypothetical protein